MSERPNFLFFITDQHRADYLGCTGHPVLKTPHIDGIAAGGTRADRFYVASPVCMPNRASLFTGRYPSVHGLRRNGLALPMRANTFLDVLKAGGYETALLGKSHVQNFNFKPAPVGDNPYADAPIPEAWKDDGGDYHQEQPSRYDTEEDFEIGLPYYGFDHAKVVTGHGDMCGGHYRQWFNRQARGAAVAPGADAALESNFSCPQAWRTSVPEDLYPTAYVRDCATAYLGDAAKSEAPFFAFVSFPDPHHPFTPPGKYWDMYDPADMVWDLPYAAHKNPPPHLAYAHDAYVNGTQNTKTPKAFMADERQIREAMALTCGMITMIDDAVGAILDTLNELGLDDNTVVVFTADHGEYLGDFNVLLKGSAHTQSISRVPFIWSDPARQTVAGTDALLSTLDIAPTILERAGLSPYNGMQGRSFTEVLDGGPGWRDALMIEHEDNTALWGFDEPAQVRTLITDDYRASVYHGASWGELYDLRNDPKETHNLWDAPTHAAAKFQVVQRIMQEMMGAGETSPWPDRVA